MTFFIVAIVELEEKRRMRNEETELVEKNDGTGFGGSAAGRRERLRE